MDFYKTLHERVKKPNSDIDYNVWPDFKYSNSRDLVVKGGDFYAFWDGTNWITDIDVLISTIDKSSWDKYKELMDGHPDLRVAVRQMDFASSGIMAKFQNYCQLKKQADIQFDTKVLFSDYTPKRSDYSTYQLSYTPTDMPTPCFDELLGILYDDKELEKILWGLGALLCGGIDKIEKFLYLYGAKGTGKGTAINIVKKMFEKYWAPIDLRTLTGRSEFATAGVAEVPLLIDADSDISKISNEQNLLKLTSHEELMRNLKFKSPYPVVFKGLLITASNERYVVKNKDSGITRRAIVVNPTGNTVPYDKYQYLYKQIDYEIPGIAYKAMQVFKNRGPAYYENLVDTSMVEYSDKVFAFIRESYFNYVGKDFIKLDDVTIDYKRYLSDMGWDEKGAKRELRNELYKYFDSFVKDTKDNNGVRIYNVYKGFRFDVAFPEEIIETEAEIPKLDINISETGEFDRIASNYPAQTANEAGYPSIKWDESKTVLSDIDPKDLHYVRLPIEHIVLDFDLKDPETGGKSLERNLEKASLYPETYAEISKSGGGVHLHYIYDGDSSKLASLIEEDIEIKVSIGKTALRRKFTYQNGKKIAHISTGLPLKEEKKIMYKDIENIAWTESLLKSFIESCIAKEHHGSTKPEIDFIYAKLVEAKESGVQYDLSNLKMPVFKFAMSSSNQAQYCMNLVGKMPFSTIEVEEDVSSDSIIVPDEEIVFFDIEVFPNLLIVCWKKYGQPGVTWINPSPEKIKELMGYNLIGFFNRKYDNHIIYNRSLGASNIELYQQSQQIVNGSMNAMMQPAYGISYADLYEFMDIKQSLKKWQIELGLKHDEFEFPWDQPLDEEHWNRCAEYCMNDVISTEEVFKHPVGQDAYTARKIMCEITGLPVNYKTQTLAEKFIFGDDERPQDKFVWYDLAEEFPGYTYSYGKSEYLGENPSEGGYVYSEPGIYNDVVLLDVASLHPHSAIAINYFGPYTPKFAALVKCRMYIKHGKFEEATHAFDDIDMEFSKKLAPYLQDSRIASGLGHAMKIIINIVYGMTSASYDNKFKAPKNVDNIIAKRGALFMLMLKHEVQSKGQQVIHIKTDSIKMPNATKEIIDYCMQRAKDFGYSFEWEATFEKMALVNKAVIIGKIGWHEKESKIGEWEAVGAEFAFPYVYKTLFSGEDLEPHDFAMLKSSKSAITLGNKFIGKSAEVYASKSGETLYRLGETDISKKVLTKVKAQLKLKSNVDGYIDFEKIAKSLDMDPVEVSDIVESGYSPRMVTTYNAVSGTKGYDFKLWSDYTDKNDIDIKYYEDLANQAVRDIYAVGDGDIIFGSNKWTHIVNPIMEA